MGFIKRALGNVFRTAGLTSTNAAQQFVLDMIGKGTGRDYKAPYAYRGTPSKRRCRPNAEHKLFNGHRQ